MSVTPNPRVQSMWRAATYVAARDACGEPQRMWRAATQTDQEPGGLVYPAAEFLTCQIWAGHNSFTDWATRYSP
jgi:hypothetical protein